MLLLLLLKPRPSCCCTKLPHHVVAVVVLVLVLVTVRSGIPNSELEHQGHPGAAARCRHLRGSTAAQTLSTWCTAPLRRSILGLLWQPGALEGSDSRCWACACVIVVESKYCRQVIQYKGAGSRFAGPKDRHREVLQRKYRPNKPSKTCTNTHGPKSRI